MYWSIWYTLYRQFKEKTDLHGMKKLIESRPTAVNLEWAVNRVLNKLEEDVNKLEETAMKQLR